MRSLAVFLAIIAIAAGAVVPPAPVPTDCPAYLLSQPANLQTPAGLLANLLIWNRGAGNLMTGTPQGPYFTIQEGQNCFWAPTGAFSCDILLYEDAAKTHFLGTGRLRSTNLISTTPTLGAGFHFVGGDISLTTNMTAAPSQSHSQLHNFLSQSTVIHFKAEQMFPDPATNQPPVANGVSTIGTTKYLTLWGSNGWNGQTYDENTRTTGFDLRVVITCPPPAPVPVPPCPDCNTQVTVPSACVDQHRTIEHTRSSNCMVMSFSRSTDQTAFQGCSSQSQSQ